MTAQSRRVLALFGLALLIGVLAWLPSANEPQLASEPEEASPRPAAVSGRIDLPSTGVSGHVTGDGRALAGATVCLTCTGCEPIGGPPSQCTFSDGRGAYALSDVAPGAYRVQSSATGFLPFASDAAQPLWLGAGQPRRDLDIALTAGGVTLAGVVQDATGGPVPHARVRAVRLMPPQFTLERECDDDGHFQFAASAGPLAIAAEAHGYAPASLSAVAPSRDITLRLTPGASVSGRVLAADGTPAARGVEVRAIATQNRNDLLFRSALSNEAGEYRLEGLEPGSYVLLARAGRGFAQSPTSIELGLAESVSGVDLTLSAAVEIRGRVRREDGGPCTQGWAALRTLSGGASARIVPEQVAEIEADGSLHFPGVTTGQYAVAVHCLGQLTSAGPQTLTVRSESLEDLEWRVTPGGSLLVHVLDALGEPVPHAAFVLRLPASHDQARAMTFYATDARGSTEIPGLAPGSYELAAPSGIPAERVESVIGTEAAQVQATLRLAGRTSIAIDVRDARGQPIDGVQVTALAAAAPDGARSRTLLATALGEGRFRIGPVPPGTYTVAVDDGVNPRQERSVSSEAQSSVRFVLARGAAIRGRVVDARAVPQPNVWISASVESASAIRPSAPRVLSDDQGEFELAQLDPSARYTVRALEPAGSAVAIGGVSPGRMLELRMPNPAALAGRVVDADGQPVESFALHAITQDSGSSIEQVRTDPGGAFELERVAPGLVQLAVEAESGAVAMASVQLSAGQRLEHVQLVVQSKQELAAAEAAAGDTSGTD